MNPNLLFLGNKKKKEHGAKKIGIGKHKVYINPKHSPARRSSGLSGILGGGMMSHALPITVGFVGGLLIPKILNLAGNLRWIVPVAVGILIPVIFRGSFVHRVAVGLISAAFAIGIDKFILAPRAQSVLAAGEFETINDELPAFSEPEELNAGEFSVNDDAQTVDARFSRQW